MAKILAAAKAVAPYRIEQPEAADYALEHFGHHLSDIHRLVGIFESSRIRARHFCVPKEWFKSPKTFKERNDIYIEQACMLSQEACIKCLAAADVAPDQVDKIIFVSTTGLATPSIDARLINLLKMRSDIKRTPVWGLGCVGGAAGLSLAFDHLRAYPDSKVLLAALELCSITFQFGDFSKSNLVAAALFGDGAAAVLLSGKGDGPEILAAQSTIWPDSLHIMGWNILNEGMQVVFNRAIPSIVSKYSRQNIDDFLGRQNLTLDHIEHFIIHPGGARVLDAYQQALCLTSEQLGLAESVLAEYGNMSSVTILYILDDFIRSAQARPGELGLMTALGPGFSSESLVFKI